MYVYSFPTKRMDFNVERENNIVKNIAKEIVLECSQNGFEATQEMADYLVIGVVAQSTFYM